MSEPLLLAGLDGSNPLAFLGLLGVGLLSRHFCPVPEYPGYRPKVPGAPNFTALMGIWMISRKACMKHWLQRLPRPSKSTRNCLIHEKYCERQ